MDGYCILKLDDKFPLYNVPSDVDIMCANKYSFAKKLSSFIFEKYKIKTKNHLEGNGNFQVDVIIENKLDIKFDISDDFSYLSKIKVKKTFRDIVLADKIKENGIFIPRLEHDLAIRYMEYKDKISERPDKIKHLNYCKRHKIDYIEVINKFTNLKK